MKKLTLTITTIILLTFTSFGQNTNVKALFKKTETRSEIFNTIVGNHELMMEFMKVMKGNKHTMMMNQDGNMKMMGNMMKMCEEDSVMRNKMTEMMIQHPEMMKEMMKRMKNYGMMKMEKMPMKPNNPELKALKYHK